MNGPGSDQCAAGLAQKYVDPPVAMNPEQHANYVCLITINPLKLSYKPLTPTAIRSRSASRSDWLMAGTTLA